LLRPLNGDGQCASLSYALVSGTFKSLCRVLFSLQSYYFFAIGLTSIFRLVADTRHSFMLQSQATLLAEKLPVSLVQSSTGTDSVTLGLSPKI
jgi:hypothetical protein